MTSEDNARRLRTLSKSIRSQAEAKRQPKRELKWKQYDCRDQLAELIGAAPFAEPATRSEEE